MLLASIQAKQSLHLASTCLHFYTRGNSRIKENSKTKSNPGMLLSDCSVVGQCDWQSRHTLKNHLGRSVPFLKIATRPSEPVEVILDAKFTFSATVYTLPRPSIKWRHSGP